MPLEVLLILVVAGISGIALLLHLSGRSAEARLDADSAVRGWARHYPFDRVGRVRASSDGRAALVATDAGPGLIWAFGSDTVARHLKACDVRDVGRGLRFDFHDYATPPVTVLLTEPERQDWRSQLQKS